MASKLAKEFHLQILGEGLRMEMEHRFHPKRRWRFDFADIDLKVAVEVHGGTFSGGRHTRGVGFEKDREKMNTAQLMGWLVIEATSNQVKSGEALTWLKEALEQRMEIS